ncbi:23655_t:CDS:2, partial [Gigaspora margarita]
MYNSTNPGNQQFIGDLIAIVNDFSFDGIDIDYPNKMPSGQFNISDIDPDIITFVNLLAFRLNINTTRPSAGIGDIQRIINSWSNYIDKSKLVLGIELGGIIEAITPSHFVRSDIANQNFAILRNQNVTFPSDENIIDPCKVTSYAHLPWQNLLNLLEPPCYTNTIQSSGWKYGFDNKSQQPYLFQRTQLYPINNLKTNYYYISYEDYQSLNAKFDLIRKNNLGGIAIPDITKDYSQLMNFVSTSSPIQPNNSGWRVRRRYFCWCNG